jgi:hypothetical protein
MMCDEFGTSRLTFTRRAKKFPSAQMIGTENVYPAQGIISRETRDESTGSFSDLHRGVLDDEVLQIKCTAK